MSGSCTTMECNLELQVSVNLSHSTFGANFSWEDLLCCSCANYGCAGHNWERESFRARATTIGNVGTVITTRTHRAAEVPSVTTFNQNWRTCPAMGGQDEHCTLVTIISSMRDCSTSIVVELKSNGAVWNFAWSAQAQLCIALNLEWTCSSSRGWFIEPHEWILHGVVFAWTVIGYMTCIATVIDWEVHSAPIIVCGSWLSQSSQMKGTFGWTLSWSQSYWYQLLNVRKYMGNIST